VAVVGAGALGNFVALGLAYSGYRNLTFLDPDTIDVTNLNRQVFFYEAVGQSKAEVLAGRLNRAFGLQARAVVDYVKGDIDLTGFDIIFDCVDNFETRIVLSERCGDLGKILISGGSGVDSGQVVVYDPQARRETPAALLGLADLVGRRQPVEGPRHQESCRFQPDPSVIMTNQIIAGFMVESLNRLLTGQEVPDIFYDARADRKF
jgi:molybdopterin/thiamine biosynthesis adenylyltransferase